MIKSSINAVMKLSKKSIPRILFMKCWNAAGLLVSLKDIILYLYVP